MRSWTPLVTLAVIVALAAITGGCTKWVPANLPLELTDPTTGAVTYQDQLGRTIGGAEADGPEYRITMTDGLQFRMKSARVTGDSVVGFYRPSGDEEWARASISAFQVRWVEKKTIDWLTTSSLIVTPITIALLVTL